MLKSGKVHENVYGADLKLKPSGDQKTELTHIRKEMEKTQKQLDRLRSLYLLDDTMSEKDFILQRKNLSDTLDALQEKLDSLNSEYTMPGVSDEEFLSKTSQFILTQKLTDRNFVSFTRLMREVDLIVIRDFILSVIDRITMNGGYVSSITFKNGLSHTFVYRSDMYKKAPPM